MKLQKVKNFVINNKWLLIGALLVILYVFSNYLYGLKLSFTNMNYSFAPFNSTGTAMAGPLLSDIADSHYPSVFRIFYSNEGFTLWDSDIALGRGLDSAVFLMNPMEWVYFLPIGIAMFLKVFSEFALGFFFMFLFMRSIGLKKYGAALSGVIYAFSSVIVVWLGWPHSDVAVWAPLLFYAIEKLINTLKIQYMFLTALSVYMMLIVTMPTYAAYFMYLAGIYIVIFTLKKHWKNKRNIFVVGGLFALGVVLATIASLPYTYTLINNVVSNGYMDSREAYGAAKLSWSYLRTLIFPYLRDGLTMHINESTIYVGLAPLVFLPLVLVNNKAKKRNLFFAAAAVVLIVLIFTDGFNFIYTRLPLVNTSLKYRVITLLTFSLSALAGISINDFVENKEYYKNKKWLFAVCAVCASVFVLYVAKQIPSLTTKRLALTIAFVIAVAVCGILCSTLKRFKGVACALMAFLIILDSTSFAANYLPWIDKDASVIPEPTDSVSYMMENTKNGERIVGLGTWMLFPNTPSYYELNDIRMHGFEATNADMKTYYTTIDSNSYTTNTRQEFNNISNYELLKYLGVKYLYGSSSGARLGSDLNHSKVFGVIEPDTTISQEIVLQKDASSISILCATYGSKVQSDSEFTVRLIKKDSADTAFETNIPLNKILDNKYLTVNFGDEIVKAGSYTIELVFDELDQESVTVWMKEDAGIVNCSNGQSVDGSLAMTVLYYDENIEYSGQDGVWVSNLGEYSDKVELVSNLQTFENETQVLNAMSKDFVKNTAFMVANSSKAYNAPLKENEKIELVTYKDNYVKAVCTTECDRYVMLNDYYNENWSAYVNGKKVEVEKTNYLMRAVKVESGKDIVVEFKYEPNNYYVIIGIGLGVILIAVVLFLFKNKLQILLDKIVVREEKVQ